MGLGTGCVCGRLTAVCPVPAFEITRSGRRAGVHGALGCDVRGWYATRREFVGMARRPQPTSTTAAPLALDHIGDHDSGVRLQWLPSRVQPAETLPRALIKGRHCSRGRILPARRCFLCCCIPYDTIYIMHDTWCKVTTHSISDMFCLCAVSLQESPLSCASCGFVAVKHTPAAGLRPGRTTSIQVVAPVGKQAFLSTPPSLGPNSLPPSVLASPLPDGKD